MEFQLTHLIWEVSWWLQIVISLGLVKKSLLQPLIAANKGSFVPAGMGLHVRLPPSASLSAGMLSTALVRSAALGYESSGCFEGH